MGRRLSQLCPLYAMPSSNSSLDYRRSDARIVENGFATTSGLSKSAKVVLEAGRKENPAAEVAGKSLRGCGCEHIAALDDLPIGLPDVAAQVFRFRACSEVAPIPQDRQGAL